MCLQVEKGLLGRKSGKGFYLYSKDKKGAKQLNPEASALIKTHQREGAEAKGAAMAADVIQDRMMSRCVGVVILVY